MSLPALRAIRAAHRDASLVLLTDRQAGRVTVTAWDVLEPVRLFDDVLFLRVPSRLRDYMALVRRVRALAPSRLYYLPPLPRTAAQTARDWLFFRVVCGISDIVGLEETGPHPVRDGRGALVRLPKESDRLLDWVAPALPPEVLNRNATRFEPSPRDRARAAEIIRTAGFAGSRLIAVGPGSKSQATQWPAHRYEQAGHLIAHAHPDARFVVFGAQHERALGDALCRAWGAGAVNVSGSLTIAEAAALLERCAVYVGNDTGTMHLAASVGTPCVAIFSARDNPGRWEPVGEGHVVLRHDVPCAGCLLTTCIEQERACLKGIEVSDVLAAVGVVLMSPERIRA